MGLLKKLLKPNLKEKQDKGHRKTVESKYMPQEEPPTDENFMNNFIQNGGKFLYCCNQTEVLTTYQSILRENYWETEDVFCYNHNLKNLFGKNLPYSSSLNTSCFLSTCEYLIANTGALLVSSNQIGENKLNDLPENLIIYATTSQLIDSIGEGLRGIKNHYENIPTNITTLKTFQGKKESNFMSYGSTSKNLYLLLLEDL